jgi:colanic acid biosynthesis glycosyl transferase WcaI
MRNLGIRDDRLTCSFVGSFSRHTNLDLVIQAARQRPDIQFVLCGNGPEEHRYRSNAESLGNVFFPGWVDGPFEQTLLDRSDIALAPYSANASMSLPNKPFVYLAAGLPLVTTLRGELETVLKPFGCAIFVDPDLPESLVSALDRLASDPGLRASLGHAARSAYETTFNSRLIYPAFAAHLAAIARTQASQQGV